MQWSQKNARKPYQNLLEKIKSEGVEKTKEAGAKKKQNRELEQELWDLVQALAGEENEESSPDEALARVKQEAFGTAARVKQEASGTA